MKRVISYTPFPKAPYANNTTQHGLDRRDGPVRRDIPYHRNGEASGPQARRMQPLEQSGIDDGIDLDPDTRNTFLHDIGPDPRKWPHHVSDPTSRPAEALKVRRGEYVIAKSGQDSLPLPCCLSSRHSPS